MTITKTNVFLSVCNWLTEITDLHLLKVDEKSSTHYYESDCICIKVVDTSSGAEKLGGAFMMETKETFYNWDNMYYSTSLPHTKEQFQQIVRDMEVIQQEEHLNKADNFYRFFP